MRPVGDISVDALLLGRRNVAWRGGAGVTLDYFVEPFLPAVGPRLVAMARSLLLFEPSWTVGVEGLFASSLRGTPPTPTARNIDETVVSVALPVATACRRISSWRRGCAGQCWRRASGRMT